MSDVAQSQVIHPRVSVRDQLRAHRRLAIAGLLALVAAAAVVVTLVVAIDGGSSESAVATPTPAQISRPDESRVAAAVGTQSATSLSGRPDESRVASAIGTRPYGSADMRPDESRVAASISGR